MGERLCHLGTTLLFTGFIKKTKLVQTSRKLIDEFNFWAVRSHSYRQGSIIRLAPRKALRGVNII